MEQLRTCIILGMLTMLFGVAYCVENVADIVFLVDSSGSMGDENFTKQKQFIANFAQSTTIGPQNFQIGVVTFSRSVRNEFDLSTHHDVSSLVNAIDAIEWMGRATYTDLGLQYVMQNSFTTAAGDRPNAPNILIVMTDGPSSRPNLTIAETVELHQKNITVFTIGIGSAVDVEELRHIASSAENEFLVDNFDALETIQLKLKTFVGLCGNYDGDASNDVDHETRNNQNQYKVDSSCQATK